MVLPTPRCAFRLDAAICDACPLRSSCVRARPGKDRLVMLHPQEALQQEARAFQQSEAFAPYRKLRQAAEHRLARLMQLGVRQARYVGRTKTLCQLLLAATVANLTLVATRVGRMRDRYHIRAYLFHQLFMSTAILEAIRRPFLVQARPALLPRRGFSATPLGISVNRVFAGRNARAVWRKKEDGPQNLESGSNGYAPASQDPPPARFDK